MREMFDPTIIIAVAALIEGRVDAAWARWVRPWTLAAWIFLTIGIALVFDLLFLPGLLLQFDRKKA